MKLRELKEKIAKIKDDDIDVVLEREHRLCHVSFAKRMTYNKRDNKYTSYIFLIVGK